MEVAVKIQYSTHENFERDDKDKLINEGKMMMYCLNKFIWVSSKYYISLLETEKGICLKQIIQQKINQNQEFSPEEKSKICFDLIEHLFKLHSQNLAHLDIKPANVIFLELQKKYIFIDFGTSHQFFGKSSNTPRYEEDIPFIGSFFYGSPEMKENIENTKPLDPFKSDIFSLGVLLLEVVTCPKPLEYSELNKILFNLWNPDSKDHPFFYVDVIDDDKSFLEKLINDPNEKPVQEVVLDFFQKNIGVMRQQKEKNENFPLKNVEKKKNTKLKIIMSLDQS